MAVTEEAWAEPSDVLRFTGIEVTDDEVLRAQDIIEIFSGTTILASTAGNASPRNERFLSRAVAYQAAWMTSNPGMYVNLDVDSLNQDGASQALSHANAALLAPLARRCLDRLSWAYRPLRTRPRYGQFDDQPIAGSLDAAAADDDREWMPMR